MNSIVKLAIVPNMVVGRRCFQTTKLLASSSPVASSSSAAAAAAATARLKQNFDPNNYSIPLRYPTMEDMMEPYGSWKVAYEAERRNANITAVKGIVCMAATLTIFYYSGILDGLWMPNLDNIMEDTEPFSFEQEGRVSVLNPEPLD